MSKAELKQAIHRAAEAASQDYAITRVRLFGSQARGDARADSDVDLLIEFDSRAVVGLFGMSDIERIFEKYLHREADITTPAGLDDLIRDRVLSEAETVYER